MVVLTNDVEQRLQAVAEQRAGDRPVGPENANHRRHAGPVRFTSELFHI
jgi:hypothetical protein